jgi:hypothetical protein
LPAGARGEGSASPNQFIDGRVASFGNGGGNGCKVSELFGP